MTECSLSSRRTGVRFEDLQPSGLNQPQATIKNHPILRQLKTHQEYMESIFSKLDATEYAKLKDAIPQITVLIAGADGKISPGETSWAEKVTNIRSYSAAEEYQDFYKEVGETFHGRLEALIAELPEDSSIRNARLSESLAGLNQILSKLEPKHAAHVYNELRSFAAHVAKAGGGFLKFWSVSAEEKKLIDLPMVQKFEWKEEEV
jgi:hypothetical protein